MGHFGAKSVVQLGIDFKSEKLCFPSVCAVGYLISAFPRRAVSVNVYRGFLKVVLVRVRSHTSPLC